MTDEPATRLEAFDCRGVYFGSARLGARGQWIVNAACVRDYEVDTKDKAVELMLALGANSIRRDNGKKAGAR